MTLRNKLIAGRNISRRTFRKALSQPFTGYLRSLPDFLIIGCGKCGTSSLYGYLSEHPSVIPARRKEIHFFDVNFGKGSAWYRSHFPFLLHKTRAQQQHEGTCLTGEATAYYIFHPAAADRVFQTVPDIKLVALLRNPVDRAFSHYQQNQRKQREPLSFEEAIDNEEQRLSGETEKLNADVDYFSFEHRHYSYLSRGIYADQLANWQRYFAPDQILILQSEPFFRDTGTMFKKIQGFLNLPVWEPAQYKVLNPGHYSDLSVDLRNRLVEYFRPHNQRLYEMLGQRFDWDG